MIQSEGGDEERDDDDDDYDGSSDDDDDDDEDEKSALDKSLEKFAKKLPIFEPGRGGEVDIEDVVKEKPLKINLDLALYKAKIFTRNFQYGDAENILQQVLCDFFPLVTSFICTRYDVKVDRNCLEI